MIKQKNVVMVALEKYCKIINIHLERRQVEHTFFFAFVT